MLEIYDYDYLLKVLKEGKTGEQILNKELNYEPHGPGFKIPKICGVYQIKNLENNKIYIGSSVDVKDRWIGHATDLYNGIHANQYLQRAWNKYGANKFEFILLDYIADIDVEFMKVKIRYIEQFYIDWFDSCNPENGYNITVEARGVVFDSSRYIKEGRSKVLDEEKFKRILDRLVNTNDSLSTIAKDENVKRSLIKDIYQKRAYKSATKDLIFQDRSKNEARRWDIKHKYWEDILKMNDEGKTPKEIADFLSVKEEDIIFLLKFTFSANTIYQYDKMGNIINTFYTCSQCNRALGTNIENMNTFLRKKRVYRPKGTNYYLSRYDDLKLTPLEEYLGGFITWSRKLVIERDKNNNIVDIYRNTDNVPGYKSGTVALKIKSPKKSDTRFFSYLKSPEEANSEEILNFLKGK